MAGNKQNSSFKAKIFDNFKNGILQKDLSIKYYVPKSTISRIVNSGNICTRHKIGRPRAKTARLDRKIKQFFTKYPRAVPREANNEIPIDANLSTIKSRAREKGHKSFRCTRKTMCIRKKNSKARIKFTKTH